MIFRRLGPSVCACPSFSLGGWLTYGGTVNSDETKEIVKLPSRTALTRSTPAEVYSAASARLIWARPFESSTCEGRICADQQDLLRSGFEGS